MPNQFDNSDLFLTPEHWGPFAEVEKEFVTAVAKFPPMNSAHEGYALILEELDELKEQVWMKQGARDVAKLRKEAIQVAAMAIRFLVDIVDGERHNV